MARLGEGLLSFFSKANRWPNSQDSTGLELAVLGRYKCWEAVGPARAEYISFQQEIEDYISQTSESLSQPTVWSLYMVGSGRDTSNPTITFISSEITSRRRLRTLVKSSGILEKHPGFVTMDINRPPGCESSIVVTLGADEEAVETASLISYPAKLYQIALKTSSNNLIGANICLDDQDFQPVATTGGLFKCDEKLFVWTAAHPFGGSAPFPETATQADYSFDLDEPSDVENEDDFVEVTSRGSKTSSSLSSIGGTISSNFEPDSTPSIRYQDDLALEAGSATGTGSVSKQTVTQTRGVPAMEEDLQDLVATVRLSGPTISSVNGSKPGLDYALFELPAAVQENMDMVLSKGKLGSCHRPISVAHEPRSTDIIVYTASGVIAGRLLETPSFIQTAQGVKAQQLWTVILKGTLYKGLCGSLVLDRSSGAAYGHIVAGAPEDGFTYIIPTYEILEDLKSRLGGHWTLLAAGGGDEMRAQNNLSGAKRDDVEVIEHVYEHMENIALSTMPKKFDGENDGGSTVSLHPHTAQGLPPTQHHPHHRPRPGAVQHHQQHPDSPHQTQSAQPPTHPHYPSPQPSSPQVPPQYQSPYVQQIQGPPGLQQQAVPYYPAHPSPYSTNSAPRNYSSSGMYFVYSVSG
ncbi:hypothetical protein K469DRAFT_204998 [Zopfia rhizophila CBS 207.26]|uniref:Uncharacterized protein n=1 Tax=Zopfia rhizophila CBS 207.26 TaxID=1314779 RepID=A0A6A6DZG9_9PEZI|nr:hypothetical protein K469DRAFT_204998 [Zopfia rhizophila CBS 207.26]